MSESISQLPAATQANATDLIPATQGSIGPGTGTTRAVTQAQIIAAGGTVTSNITLDAGGGWSSNNVGKQLLVTTPAAASNPGIGITDSGGINLWGVWNHSGVLTMSVMPAYSDDVTGPINIASLSSAGIAVTGTLSSSGALTVSAGGATITAGGLTVTAGGVTVTAGGAAITGASAVTGALTVSTAGTSGNQVVNFSQFAPSVSANGYTKLPGGLVLQWGSASSGASQDFGVTFPIAFPTAVFSVGATVANTADATTNRVAISGASTTSFAAHVGTAGLSINWMAAGN